MTGTSESLEHTLRRFIGRSKTGFLQLLVAAARPSTFRRIIACPTYPFPVHSEGLQQAVHQLRAAMLDPQEHVPTLLATLFSMSRDLEHRKAVGQFFTAADVAEWALKMVPPLPSDHVCDAGSGTAVFACGLLQGGYPVESYLGIENDPTLALCAAHALDAMGAPSTYKIWYTNFMLLSPLRMTSQIGRLPTYTIANPPFVRYHNLRGRARIRGALKASLGLELSALSGSSSYFVARAAELTAGSNPGGDGPPGRMVFLLPLEAAGAAHARRLRSDLERIHGWSSREYPTESSQTGIGKHPSNALALMFVFSRKKSRATSFGGINNTGATLGAFLRVRRGIATGRNDYFVLTEQAVTTLQIPHSCLRKVLPTRVTLPANVISGSDWETFRREGEACWLLSLPPDDIRCFDPAVQSYLKEGLRRGIHATATAGSLRVWYSLPIPQEPPDLFITYLFRGAPRFILNRARVIHLTNILGGRFTPSIKEVGRQRQIIEALNCEGHRWIQVDLAGREYRGGLRKIEPGEFANLPVTPKVMQLVALPERHLHPSALSLFD